MGKEVKTFADLKVGLKVEVKYNKLVDKNLAVTVKIMVSSQRGAEVVAE
jgi:preprotein translocase subunit SecB